MAQQVVINKVSQKMLRWGNCDFEFDGSFDPVTEEIVVSDFEFEAGFEYTWNGLTFIKGEPFTFNESFGKQNICLDCRKDIVQAAGLVIEGTVGEAISVGNVLYLNSNEKYYKGDATDGTKMPAVVMAIEDISINTKGKMLRFGCAMNPSWSWATSGALLYISTTTGEMTETAPSEAGSIVQAVGHVISEKAICFCPEHEANINEGNISVIFDGGGVVIAVDEYLDIEVPFDCNILACYILADQAGTITIDIWKSTYAAFPPVNGGSITAAATPTTVAANKYEDTTLIGWGKTLSKGDILRFATEANDVITRATIALMVKRI